MNVINTVTLKTLKKNKSRTIVTIIGVILSAAMISAVTTFISSIQNLMIKSIIATDGRWQASISDVPYQDISKITDNSNINEAGIQHTLGYAKLNGSRNPNKPYLYVQELDSKSMELYTLRLKEGRLPEKEGELLISEQIQNNGGVSYSLGETINLDIGNRFNSEGTVLNQKCMYSTEEITESFIVKNTRTFTIVGISEKPSYEPFNAPGYTVITPLNTSALTSGDKVNTAFCIKNPRDILKLAPDLASYASLDKSNVTLHKDLLEYMGISQNRHFRLLLYSLGGILIGMIMIGSISLIYNAFAISISERSKQFGMLSGVGATSKQIRNSVFFEAGFISIIGIPIGILSGILGISVTLYLLRGIFNSFTNIGVPFTVSISIPSIIVAVIVGFITILLSAWIPARRASHVSPIEAIQQTNEVKIKSKNVKTSRVIRKLFGMEGDIGLKNFKRNRRRYRATVISLFISIVLFISASSLTMYIKAGVETAYANVNYDIRLVPEISNSNLSDKEKQKLIDIVKNTDKCDRYSIINGLRGNVSVDPNLIRSDLVNGKKPELKNNQCGTVDLSFNLFTVNDEEFERYIQKLGLNKSEYTDTAHPKGFVYDNQQYYNNKGKMQGGRLFKSQSKSVLNLHNTISSENNNAANVTVPLQIGAIVDETPLGVEGINYMGDMFTVIVSNQVYNTCFKNFTENDRLPQFIGIKTSKPDVVDENLKNELKQQGITYATTENIAKMLQNTRNVLLIVNVFTYGFIILITLITIANVFNTISTNVNLRRREFAMLKSVGMTSSGFNRMINFECIFYGLKALLYGLPISLFLTWLIHKAVSQSLSIPFHIPWLNVLFCTIAVFFIVFITMMYSMSKVRKENIVDALKNENL